jgi:hypothetical protein
MAEAAHTTVESQPKGRNPQPAPSGEERAPVFNVEQAPGVATGDGGDTAMRPGAILGDPRLLQRMGVEQRARLVRQFQRGHGNSHVARAMAQVHSDAAVIQRKECPPEAAETAPIAPEHDPNFQSTTAKADKVAAKEKQHPTAKSQAGEAQNAAVGPPNDIASQAAASQVGKMDQKQPGAFDKPAFVAALKKAIDAIAPKNNDEAENLKGSGRTAEMRSKVGGMVSKNKEVAEKDIKEATKAPPDTSAATPKPVAPMKPTAPGALPAGIGAANAMPEPKPAAETSLENGPCAVDSKMADANVTDEQIKKSNEPEFNKALDTKKDAEVHAKTAPQEFKADERATLGQAKADAQAGAAGALQGMHAGRAGALAQVLGSKNDTKGQDEAKRAEFASKVQAIYNETKGEVEGILGGLEGKVDAAFDAGEKAARTAFENEIDTKTSEYKKKRYLGNPALWLVDKFKTNPELDKIVDTAVKSYFKQMDVVIDRVADIVGGELTRAKARITQGRQQIKAFVDSQPKALKQLAGEAAGEIQGKFDQLDQDVNSKQEGLIQNLAQKYAAARDAVNERATAMKEANKGLVDKAMEEIDGVISTIMKLKEMLTGALAKAASVIDTIIKDPIAFLGNLVGAIKLGLGQFVANIAKHLKNGLMGWLFGQLGSAGITLPKSFDLKGILQLVLQLLGLTYPNIRARAVKIVGEKAIGRIEQTVEVFKLMLAEGPAGLWVKLKDQLSSLKESVMGQIQEFVITKIVTAGITWLMSLLNPASAFIRACKMIYDVVMFFIERGSQIMGLVNSILDSIGAIAGGALGAAANLVESSLAKALPVAISFLASLLGLGGIGAKIKSVIDAIQKPVGAMVDKVVMAAVKGFKKLKKSKVGRLIRTGIVKAKRGFRKAKAYLKAKAKEGKEWAKGKLTQLKTWAKTKFQKAGAWVKGKYEKLFGKKNDRKDDSKEDVKNSVRKALSTRLKPQISDESEVQPILLDVFQAHQKKGLKELYVAEKPGLPGSFEIYAVASPGKGVKKFKTKTYKFTEADIEAATGLRSVDFYLGFGKTALSANLNDIPLGRHESKDMVHAETSLLNYINNNWSKIVGRRATKSNRDIIISININRSPCAVCAGNLLSFITTRKQQGYNISMNINIVSLYKGKHGEFGPEEEALKKLSKKANVNVLDVITLLKNSGIPIDKRHKAVKAISDRIKHFEEVLNRIKSIRIR